jgi:hypothetical protein
LKLKLVEVEWQDISSDAGWTSHDELDKKLETEEQTVYLSSGWLYKKTRTHLWLLPSISVKADKVLDSSSYEIIPLGAIVKIRRLIGGKHDKV